MGNLSVPQPKRDPTINLPVPPEEPQRLSPSFPLLSKIIYCLNWMAGFLMEKRRSWMAGRDQEKHVLPVSSSPCIVSNSDFSVKNLENWDCIAEAKSCVIVDKSPYPCSERETYAIINIWNKWQVLQQEIHVSPHITYKLVARVGVLGILLLGIHPDNIVEVQAALVLEIEGSRDYEFKEFARVNATSHGWTSLKGSFKLNAKYHRVFLCLRVPDPSVNLNLLVAHVDIRPS